LQKLNPGVEKGQLIDGARQYAKSQGLSLERALQQSLNEARTSSGQAARLKLAQMASSGGGGGTVNLGAAQRKGDIFVSPSSTLFVQHGHTGVYYTTSVIVEAPGTGKKSRSIATGTYKVGKGAVKQAVSTTQTKRNSSANHAYNKLRGKSYNTNFAFNKSTTGASMNCSQLVWSAFKVGAGIDLDGNGGPGVYPYNIKDSKLTSTYKTL